MHLAFVVYDRMTAMDFVGAYDPLTRLGTMEFRDDVTWDVCARRETVTATGGLEIGATAIDEPLDADLVVVPGGFATRELVEDERFLDWLRTAEGCDLLASVCTGSLLLGAAGFLEGRRATTHPDAYDELAAYCTVVEERVVDDGDLVTARGVTSSLDLGLHLCERLADRETREAIATQMDYPYDTRGR